MTELFAIGTGMIGFLKSMDASQAVIMTVIVCALLVLLFNVIAIWKLTAPSYVDGVQMMVTCKKRR